MDAIIIESEFRFVFRVNFSANVAIWPFQILKTLQEDSQDETKAAETIFQLALTFSSAEFLKLMNWSVSIKTFCSGLFGSCCQAYFYSRQIEPMC